MSVTDQIISAPGTGTDVQTVLNNQSNVGYDLMVDTNINKWAKYKPVQLNQNMVDDQLKIDLTWRDDSSWWKAQDGKCGLAYVAKSTAAAVKTAVDKSQKDSYNGLGNTIKHEPYDTGETLPRFCC